MHKASGREGIPVYMDKIGKKISSALYSIKTAKNMLTPKALLTLYYALVHCHLVYCVEIWSCGDQTAFKKLCLKQKIAIRLATGSKYNFHTEPLFKQTRVLPLTQLADFFKYQLMFKFSKNILPTSFNTMWLQNYERQNLQQLRNMNDLFIPRINIKRLERFPFAYFAKLWNNLWQEIKDINSKSLFCNNLKEYFLSNLAGNVTCNRLLCPQCHLRPNSPTRIN